MGQACWRNGVTIKTKFATPDRDNENLKFGNAGGKQESSSLMQFPEAIEEKDEEESSTVGKE